jgi:hypothetical protein
MEGKVGNEGMEGKGGNEGMEGKGRKDGKGRRKRVRIRIDGSKEEKERKKVLGKVS